MTRSDDWLIAAQLLRPQGRRGELLADPHTDLAVFSPGRKLWLGTEGAAPQPSSTRELQDAWQPTGRNAGRIVLKLSGIDSISAAEALAGQFVLLPIADLPALDEDTFRVRDLVGCALYDGEHLAGTVVDVQFPVGPDGRTRLTDAPDLLAIEPAPKASDPAATAEQEQERTANASTADDRAETVLIPFVRAWLIAVDLPGKRITMNLPPGLTSSEGDTLDQI